MIPTSFLNFIYVYLVYDNLAKNFTWYYIRTCTCTYTHTLILTHIIAFSTSLSFCFSVAPYSVVIMGDNTYSQGQQLQLTCYSEGGPQLGYTWIFSDDVIHNQNTSTLTIDNIATTNGGDYTCNVTNDAGVGYDKITVYSELFVCLLHPLPV